MASRLVRLSISWCHTVRVVRIDGLCLIEIILFIGMDGGRFDWVKVRTSYVNDLLACNFYSFLDGNDHEMGSECTVTG